LAFTDKERAKIEAAANAFIERRRPPMHNRNRLDFCYRIDGQSVALLEIRPAWDDPSRSIERPFARMTFVRTRGQWHLYWKRASGRWDRYDPAAASASLSKVLKVVDEDGHGCFFG
jgi:hypothetical protein